ncbi:MAG: 4-phosphoerythronate dehydrogenase, partial [Alistipes sp.]|nr:4-phosphoerythronate dehydrogenase [Alistipes sp.]
PLTRIGEDATYHMAGGDFFASLQRGALVINSARGEVVDGDIMRDCIAAERCRAAIDTWEHEPGIDRRLLSLATIATPHIAGYTAQGKANATAMAVGALTGFFGFPLEGWYPPQVERIEPREISWLEMMESIGEYCDLRETDRCLRDHPAQFESLRINYRYRQEYF